MRKEKTWGQFSKNYRTFHSNNCHFALNNMGLGSEIRGLWIQNPGFGIEKAYSGSRILGGSRGQKGTGSRILDPDPQHCR